MPVIFAPQIQSYAPLERARAAADCERLLPHLEPIALPLGWALHESGDRLTHVFFPTEGIVSLLYVMENGASAEVAVTGNQGLIGVSLLMGGGGCRGRG